LAARLAVYVKNGMMISPDTFIVIFFWAQFVLFFYLISSIAAGAADIRRVKLIFSALETHY
jgi:hypothetical protein